MKVESTKKFVARTQYGDWEGTIAMDNGEVWKFHEWLEQEGQLDKNDHVCGIEIHGDYPGSGYGEPRISVLIFEIKNGRILREVVEDGEEIPLKRLFLSMSLQDFLGKFKRLDTKLSENGCLDGQSIVVTETKEL